MAKVITFSRKFPSYHPKAGSPTYFVEQILNQLSIDYTSDSYLQKLLVLNTKNIANGKLNFEDIESFHLSLQDSFSFKSHTIRNGNRFKKGELFSPRCWFGNPYNSPQIIFWDDTEVRNDWKVEIYSSHEVYIDGVFHCSFGSENWEELCKNDGLSSRDMKAWFSKLPFSGQIICWNENVKY